MKDSRFEDQYLVLKFADVEKYLGGPKLVELRNCLRKVESCRVKDGKSPIRGIVIRDTWPEYEDAARSLYERTTGAEYPTPQTFPVATVSRETARAYHLKRLEQSICGLRDGINKAVEGGGTQIAFSAPPADAIWLKEVLWEYGYKVTTDYVLHEKEYIRITW